MVSMGGSVLPGPDRDGARRRGRAPRPIPRRAHHARWFIAHEAAHFWLGQAISYDRPRDSWITEGGADLLAFRATAAVDPTYDVRERAAARRAPNAAVPAPSAASPRPTSASEHRAYYACGAVFALVAEQASGGNFGDFVAA